MPLAEATYDHALLSNNPSIEPRQQESTTALESSLEVARTMRYLDRVRDQLGILRGCGLESSLGGRSIRRCDGKQCDPGGVKQDAYAVSPTYTLPTIKRFVAHNE